MCHVIGFAGLAADAEDVFVDFWILRTEHVWKKITGDFQVAHVGIFHDKLGAGFEAAAVAFSTTVRR